MQPLSSTVRSALARLVQENPLGEAGSAYLERRGLLGEATARLSLGEVSAPARETEKYAGRLMIPSFSARDTPVFVTFRCMEDHDCREAGHAKYLNWPGLDSRLFNVKAVTSPDTTIHLCEGQLDAATLVACGVAAVGIPGSQAWAPHAHRLFQGFDRVLFWADRDDKGASMELFARIRQSLPQTELVHLPEGDDVNSLFVREGRDTLMALCADRGECNNDSSDEDEVLDVTEGETDEPDPYADWQHDYPPPPF